MAKKHVTITIMTVITLGIIHATVVGQERGTPRVMGETGADSSANKGPEGPAIGDGMAAIKHAAEAGKYLFVFFHNGEDQQTQAMRQVFDAAMERIADKAESRVIDTTDRTEKGIVDKFDARRAPMPLVLAIAPNGAITGGFPIKFTEELLMGALVSPSTAQCMKALQDGKMVFLCVQDDATKFGKEAMQAVRAVQSDPKYAKSTEIVAVDPSDEAEAVAMKRLQVDTGSDEAITILMTPPGTVISRIEGATTKQSLVAVIQGALAKAKGGCCPGGKCGPKKAASSKSRPAKRKS